MNHDIHDILNAACIATGAPVDYVLSRDRSTRAIAHSRTVAVGCMRDIPQFEHSFPTIARVFGNDNHSSTYERYLRWRAMPPNEQANWLWQVAHPRVRRRRDKADRPPSPARHGLWCTHATGKYTGVARGFYEHGGSVSDHRIIVADVLDPFAGAGTTLMVACQLGRDAIGIELNPKYAKMADDRIRKALRPSTARTDNVGESPLFSEVE